ncbi:MAG: hypothetical protein A2655_04195 [Candidatus Yanofskybacteria bacterium RIFCSPHIGHO2_01_FULL_43_42]|uniref:Uncharacterized protein n=1 Tax=Candidatus Yanofskybacteria bacterium RIFCSPLOWO2_01_FULL_43_22 TaxID=1802695 RepID=A0A1F8GF16_9BACT|nr:MAG: hypothetical protein A2655_04195 [Candidatus Yanofskybacteria bacterium RIFCSPHIGHO2_01_FULL_43_42]OGN12694.1 MAG: hypothetical protein A3D48_01545 [Candidatus Yanofskybacteria bacterium RIFCSPHIGHO2_02_FULL_43_17]OGN23316.1 MAG: hypothetical protein A3A13_04315 [Candidatus Yanofskybacteria bacterium RIFCSPLOWO2_01_FULL_43_22]
MAGKVSTSSTLGPEEVLIYNILKSEPMATDDLVGCLMSEPYGVSFDRILEGLNILLFNGFIRALNFKSHPTQNYKICVRLTVNPMT